MASPHARWAVRLWVAAIGSWLVVDAARHWQFNSSSTTPIAPPSAVGAAMSDRYATWFRKFAQAPKRGDGLPATDLPDIFQKADEPLLRPPASKRAHGDRLELYRPKDGPAISYDVSGEKGLITIATAEPVTQFKAGDSAVYRPLIPVPGGVAIDVATLPLSFFGGAFRERRTVLQLYDVTGVRRLFLRLSLEDSAEISVFKGSRPRSPLGPEFAEQLLLSSKERHTKATQDHFKHLIEISEIRNIASGDKPSQKPRSCVDISPIVISTAEEIDGSSISGGVLAYDPTSDAIVLRGAHIPAASYVLEIEISGSRDKIGIITRRVNTTVDTLQTPISGIPPEAFSAPALTQLRVKSAVNANQRPDATVFITHQQMHDLKLCHDNPARKLSDTVGKD